MKTLVLFLCLSLGLLNAAFAQGPLVPPGPPAPTMKTLDQIEPRIAITNIPCVITNSGSYYLTGNLTCAVDTNIGILVDADDVTIDMRGFTLYGKTGGAGSGHGIYQEVGRRNLTLKNGTLAHWAGSFMTRYYLPTGVRVMGDGNRIEQVTVVSNTAGLVTGRGNLISKCQALGISQQYPIAAGPQNVVEDCVVLDSRGSCALWAGQNSTLTRCVVQDNRATEYGIFASLECTLSSCVVEYNSTGGGLYADQNCVLSDCVADGNQGNGIVTVTACTVNRCTATGNGTNGFALGIAATISKSTSCANGADGISVRSGSVVEGCTANLNSGAGIVVEQGSQVRGCTSYQNGANGLVLPNDCQAMENTCTGNGLSGDGAGIYVTSAGCRVERNNCVLNKIGIHVIGNPNFIVANSCRWNSEGLSNYVITAGNSYGQIISSPGAGFVSTDPWANFEF